MHKSLRPSLAELGLWLGTRFGKHKIPQHVFVFGEDGIPEAVAVTSSEKIQKNELREMSRRALGLDI